MYTVQDIVPCTIRKPFEQSFPNVPQGYEDSNKLNIDKNNIHAIILSMNVFNKNFTILTTSHLINGLLKHRWHNTNNCTIISEIVYSGMS